MDNGVIYVRTDMNSCKVKCAWNNSGVRIIPCNVGGRLKGEWIDGKIQFSSVYESQQANQLLNQKYDLRGIMLGIMYKLRKIEFVIPSIHFGMKAARNQEETIKRMTSLALEEQQTKSF